MRTATFVLALLSTFLALPGCNHNSPPPNWTGQVIDCGGEVIRKCGPQLLGPVNTCLAKEKDWSPCLIALIPGAECAGETPLACVVRHTGATAAAGSDTVSAREATNAKAFIRERGYTYTDSSGALPAEPWQGARLKDAVGLRDVRQARSTAPPAVR